MLKKKPKKGAEEAPKMKCTFPHQPVNCKRQREKGCAGCGWLKKN